MQVRSACREVSAICSLENRMSVTEQQQCELVQSFAFVLALSLCIGGHGWLAWGNVRTDATTQIILSGRVNPNEASVASLMRLPGIGAVRAAGIVAYREQFGEEKGGLAAFCEPDGLQKIKGIGPKTVDKIRNYLEFDEITHED